MNKSYSLFYVFFVLFLGCSSNSENEIPVEEADKITVSTSDFTAEIDENPQEGAIIGVIPGKTNIGRVKFALTEQLPAGALNVDPNTGELTVANASLFDFEEYPSLTASVSVANGTVSETSTIGITLKDVLEKKVYQGDVTFNNQSEINSFGAEHYTHVTGSLMIYEEFDQSDFVEDLTPLSSLVSVEQVIGIVGTDKLKTLDGLENLVTAGGIGLSSNKILEDIRAFSQITSLAEPLGVFRNPLLTSLYGLHNITTVKILNIQECAGLKDLSGLDKLQTVEQTVHIVNNANLESLHGLEQLTSLSVSLVLDRNASLTSVEALSNLTTFNRTLNIYQNDSLEDLTGLAGSSYYVLRIINNASLNNLDGLTNLEIVETGIELEYNPELTNLDALSQVRVTEYVLARYNDKLVDYCGLTPSLDAGYLYSLVTSSNGYNPAREDLMAGDCSL